MLNVICVPISAAFARHPALALPTTVNDPLATGGVTLVLETSQMTCKSRRVACPQPSFAVRPRNGYQTGAQNECLAVIAVPACPIATSPARRKNGGFDAYLSIVVEPSPVLSFYACVFWPVTKLIMSDADARGSTLAMRDRDSGVCNSPECLGRKTANQRRC
jgi:hypothetical protein